MSHITEPERSEEVRRQVEGRFRRLVEVMPGIVGVGIAGMSERMEQLGGTLEITSGDQGTTVRARLQLVKDAG